jgi:hypothetical protein
VTALDHNPTTTAFAASLNFQLRIARAPDVTFFVQDVDIPEIRLPPANTPSPFKDVPYPGDQMEMDILPVRFIVDESFTNYETIYQWMRYSASPYDDREYRRLYTGKPEDGPTSTIDLYVMSGVKNPRVAFTFVDAFPIRLGRIRMSSTSDDVKYVVADVDFTYTYFDISRV